MENKVFNTLIVCGGLAMLAGLLLLWWEPRTAFFVYSSGAAAYLVGRLKTDYRGEDFRLRRLRRIQLVALLLYVAAAVLMYLRNDLAVLAVLTGAVTDLTVIFRKGSAEKKAH